MHWRTALIVLLVAALGATGCTSAGQEPTRPRGELSPTASPAASPQVLPPPPAPQGTILTDAAGMLVRTDLSRVAPVKPEAEGLYLFDIASGKLESWIVAGTKLEELMRGPAFRLSGDGRWVIARSQEKGYLADRTGTAAYQWDRSQFELVAASGQALVFEQTTASGEPRWYRGGWGAGGHTTHTGAFHILGGDLTPKATFTLPSGGDEPRPTLVSPDGKQLALLAGKTLHLVDLTSGQVQTVAEAIPADRLTLVSGGKEFLAEPPFGTGALEARRFDWSGKALGAVAAGKVSPDGALTLETEFVGGFTPAVQVVDNQTNAVRYRILGADTCYGSGLSGVRWTADGSAFLVRTAERIQLVSADGRLQPLSLPFTFADGYHEPIPAPHDASLLLDRVYRNGVDTYSVVTVEGEYKMGFALQHVSGMEHASAVPVWHPTGRLIQLSLYMRGGHDGPCGDYSIPVGPKVEKPPFSDDLKLLVQNTGDCLNVRAAANTNSTRLGCYKDGTVLPLVRSGQGWLDAQTWSDHDQWARVKTPDGQVGWASLKDGYLTWATN